MGNTQALCSRNHSHRSKLESSVCEILQLRELAGEIKLLQVEAHVKLSGWYTYIPDFKCLDLKTNEEFFVEAKGFANDRWPSTRKGWKHAGPGKLEVYKGTWQRPVLDEIIIPKESVDKDKIIQEYKESLMGFIKGGE